MRSDAAITTAIGTLFWRNDMSLSMFVTPPLRHQLLRQRLRLLQVARIEPLRKPPVNRSQQLARLLHVALVTREARKAHCGAQFPGFGLLLLTISGRVNSAACNLTKSYMLIGSWPVSLNRSSVMRS